MTNEKAIDTINSLKQHYNDKNENSCIGFDNEDNEALDMAIKALEQKSYKSEARKWKRRYLDLKKKEKEWLSSFNTDSATCCFTAVNQLKQELEEKD